MNKKGLIRLVVILVAIVVAYILVLLSEKISQNALRRKLDLSKVIPEVQKVEIKYARQHYTIYKEGGEWLVKNIENGKQDLCDTGRLNTFFNTLKRVEIFGIAADQPQQYFEFGVDDTSAVYIKLVPKKGKPVALYIGKAGPDYNSAFLRLPKDKKVYLVRNITPYRVKRTFKYWRYRKIWKITMDNLSELQITYKHKKVRLYKKQDEWYKKVGRKEEKADTAFVQDIVTKLNNIMIDEYAAVPDTSFYKLDKSKYSLQVVTTRKEYLLRFGKVTNARYATEISSKPGEIYLINTYRIDNISRKFGLKIK